MAIEVIILLAIAIFVFAYTGRVNTSKFFEENFQYLIKLKEPDYDFLVRAKYGDEVIPDVLFQKRIRNAVIVMAVALIFFITNLTYIHFILAIVVGIAMFKLDHFQLKGYYKRHLALIDSYLPYYLKGLEILIQHYTVPVAIGRSINDAPEIFREGLQEIVDEINTGNQTIDPYMNFAKKYPVRDSMRMMRLLYRLSLGRQERKQEQLLTFSRSISSLTQKARETKYKNRLEKMENKTMSMLVTTGFGVMILLVISVLMMIGFS
jgi:hypothetical protein